MALIKEEHGWGDLFYDHDVQRSVSAEKPQKDREQHYLEFFKYRLMSGEPKCFDLQGHYYARADEIDKVVLDWNSQGKLPEWAEAVTA